MTQISFESQKQALESAPEMSTDQTIHEEVCREVQVVEQERDLLPDVGGGVARGLQLEGGDDVALHAHDEVRQVEQEEGGSDGHQRSRRAHLTTSSRVSRTLVLLSHERESLQ